MSQSIQVQFNGKTLEVSAETTISDLLELVGMRVQLVAVERNLEIVPRDLISSTSVSDGDVIEAVTLVGGG